jgi:hypothetical protein
VVLRRPRPVPAPRVMLAFVAGALVLGTSLPVQVSLLLLPLVALAGLRWRDHLIWAGTEVVYFVGVWLYIAAQTEPNRGLPAGFYLVLLLARLAGIAWLGIQAVRTEPPALPGAAGGFGRPASGRSFGSGEAVDGGPLAPDLWTVSLGGPERR